MKKYKPKKWVKVVIVLILFISIIGLFTPKRKSVKAKQVETKRVVRKIEIAPAYYKEPVVENAQNNEEIVQNVEENNNEIENIVETNEESNNEIQSIVDTSYTTRMTSYYPEESSDCTGSGLCSWDFETNEFGWYTYQGKLVVATATMYLLNEGFTLYDGVHTYRYYDEITLNIDGVDYQAIVLDSCGSSMKTDRIDLFVSGSWAVKDTMIEVRR